MDRIDSLGNVGRRFSDGNPQLGQIATRLSAKWHNAVQEEIMGVIEAAGIAPSHDDNTQLLDAMTALISGVIGSGGGAVPTTRTITGAGLLAGQGGSLAANRVFTVTKASAADVLAGTADDRAITPLALKTALAGSLGNTGYYILAGGLIMQWGIVRGVYNEGSISVTLPIAFPSVFASLVLTTVNQAASVDRNVWSQSVSRSLSGFTAFQQYTGDGSSLNDGFDFIAFGF